MERLKEILFDLFDEYEEAQEIRDALWSEVDYGAIT